MGVGDHFNVAVVGATGAVGAEFLSLFEQRKFPINSINLLASARSVGKSLSFKGKNITIQEAGTFDFSGIDLAFFSAGASTSRALAEKVKSAGAFMIDNSSAFRMDPSVPLIVPEVNPTSLVKGCLIASVPNCTAIILNVAVHPLRQLGTIDRLIVSTYQSASGGGASMMQRLLDETLNFVSPQNATELGASKIPPYAFNLFSHNTPIDANGYNEEEAKVIEESRKILGLPNLKINVTCVRVPVLRAHTETVTVEFSAVAPSMDEIRTVFSMAPGIRLVDDRDRNHFPTPQLASGQGDVLVGRLRQDLSNPNAISMLIAGDQLLKGAALNAVQIAELWIEQKEN